MKKFSTIDENILLTNKYPKDIKLFLNFEIERVRIMTMNPGEVAVKNILNYSKALSVHKTKKDVVNVVLN